MEKCKPWKWGWDQESQGTGRIELDKECGKRQGFLKIRWAEEKDKGKCTPLNK